jgi:hypothetical protein
MKKYKKMLAFYAKLIEVINFSEKELPYQVGIEALELFEEVKDVVSLTEFTVEHVNELHSDFDLRESYAEAAFKDLAPYLRDPAACKVVEDHLDRSGTGRDDLYMHVRNVRLLENNETDGPAVVTIVVHSYEALKELFGDKRSRPEVIHGSFGEKATDLN